MKTLQAATLLCALSLSNGVVSAQLEPNQCADYRGKLGDNSEFGDLSKIGMSLFVADKDLNGTYFHEERLKDISLAGSYESDRDINLVEFDSSGKANGTFKLRFVESDPSRKSDRPLTGDVLKGTWTHGPGHRTFPVFLSLVAMRPGKCLPRYHVAGASDDEIVERNIQAFYFAVLKRQKSIAAEYVSYPATFQLAGKRRKLANVTDFLQYYDRLFTKKFVARIAEGVPHNMFANSRGVMIADGAVWFNEFGKAIAFNNAP